MSCFISVGSYLKIPSSCKYLINNVCINKASLLKMQRVVWVFIQTLWEFTMTRRVGPEGYRFPSNQFFEKLIALPGIYEQTKEKRLREFPVDFSISSLCGGCQIGGRACGISVHTKNTSYASSGSNNPYWKLLLSAIYFGGNRSFNIHKQNRKYDCKTILVEIEKKTQKQHHSSKATNVLHGNPQSIN